MRTLHCRGEGREADDARRLDVLGPSVLRAGDDEDTLDAVADGLAKQIREKLGTGPVGSG